MQRSRQMLSREAGVEKLGAEKQAPSEPLAGVRRSSCIAAPHAAAARCLPLPAAAASEAQQPRCPSAANAACACHRPEPQACATARRSRLRASPVGAQPPLLAVSPSRATRANRENFSHQFSDSASKTILKTHFDQFPITPLCR